ncbi:HD-GYP domain-containing protein [Halomonas stenophila]|uniref:Putative nucleotidyltransferase with HDIG domain n=1 Tax=Halomonas stenophila TaxID=795312 RepID=A0A7W5EQT7_9GAMM|nr:HD-GYP domain-containing protein [Halomonas stenophila]MBB3229772.1 putative nucleotidyltransferase with HDIG domain [Halomonas stenophila]
MVNNDIPAHRSLINIPASELKIGMYVAGLDRPWLETPFPLEGVLIATESDIKEVRKYASTVYISVEESYNFPSPPTRHTAFKLEGKPLTETGDRAKIKASPCVGKEIRRIKEEHSGAKGMIKKLMSDKQNWHKNIPETRRVVKTFAASIARNQNALYWLTRIKNKNAYTAEHCLNVGILAMVFARHLGWEMHRIEEVGLSGMLHDVGKMNIPLEILDKPGKLNVDEYEIIKKHVLEGYKILSSDNTLPETVLNTSRDHHERMNGQGYPYGKKGGDLSDEAKLIAIVDTYDAITSDRVYSPAEPPTHALKVIYENAGELFDKLLSVKFIECIGIYPPGSSVELDTGETAIVIEQAPERKLQPKIFILPKKETQPISEGTFLDLSNQRSFFEKKITRAIPEGHHATTVEEVFKMIEFQQSSADILI